MRFEATCPTGPGGTPPRLDLLAEEMRFAALPQTSRPVRGAAHGGQLALSTRVRASGVVQFGRLPPTFFTFSLTYYLTYSAECLYI